MNTMNDENPDFILTSHAHKVIFEREIKFEWISRVLSNPEKIELDEKDISVCHMLGRIPENENRVLRVVFTRSDEKIKIITSYFDRTMRKRI
jgi:hypothetical protein